MGHLRRHSSPLVPPFDAFFALGGVLALGGVAVLLGVVFEWVVLAACPKGLKDWEWKDVKGLMSQGWCQHTNFNKNCCFNRISFFAMKIVGNINQHQSLFQQVRRRLAFWFHNTSSRNVKERFWAELQPLLPILRTKLSGKRNTEGSCFLCLALDHRQSPLTHDSFSQFSPAQQLFPLPLHLSKDLNFEKWRKKKTSWLAGTSHGFPLCHHA